MGRYAAKPSGKWEIMRQPSGLGIRQRTLVGPDGTQWAVTKARSTAKHSNGVEWLIHRNGVLVDYARKLNGALLMAEDFAAGRREPIGSQL